MKFLQKRLDVSEKSLNFAKVTKQRYQKTTLGTPKNVDQYKLKNL